MPAASLQSCLFTHPLPILEQSPAGVQEQGNEDGEGEKGAVHGWFLLGMSLRTVLSGAAVL
jgi:hypothetical protein